MKFADLLIAAIQRSEIPVRFEPGAEEAVAKPVTELIQGWLEAHLPTATGSDFERGRAAAIAELIEELTGARNVPSE